MRKTARFLYGLFFAVSLFAEAHAAIIVGNPSGKITLTEVFDYQCPHCQHEARTVQAIEINNPALKIKLLPVALLNSNSLIEATAAYAESLTGKHFYFLNRAFLNEQFYTAESIYNFLARTNLATPVLLKTMHSQTVLQQLTEGTNLLKHFHTVGVPFFVLSKQQKIIFVHEGELTAPQLQEEIDRVMVQAQ